MKRIKVSKNINCPVEKAFAYSTDSTKWYTWMAFIPEAEQTSPSPVKVGTPGGAFFGDMCNVFWVIVIGNISNRHGMIT
jgi:hypothetical protein